MLDKTLAIILAGGVGTRLQPLTDDRAKPAVPFGGKYRIIDKDLAVPAGEVIGVDRAQDR